MEERADDATGKGGGDHQPLQHVFRRAQLLLQFHHLRVACILLLPAVQAAPLDSRSMSRCVVVCDATGCRRRQALLELGWWALASSRASSDDADLRGGRRREFVLDLQMAAPASPWHWDVEWTHARQPASEPATFLRGGVAVGTVRQPRIDIDHFALTL